MRIPADNSGMILRRYLAYPACLSLLLSHEAATAEYALPPLQPQAILAIPPANALARQPVRRQEIASLPARSWRQPRGDFDVISVQPILFAHDSARIAGEHFPLLEKVARFIDENSPLISRVLINAQCDETASEDYNYRLARKRARAIRQWLQAKDVPVRLLKERAVGEAMPVDEPWQVLGRSNNRRVEIQIFLRRSHDQT